MNAAMDHAFWERIANGSPLIVLILIVALGIVWRYLIQRQAAFDKALSEERASRERMQTETLTAITTMKLSVDRNTDATRELTSAIRERGH